MVSVVLSVYNDAEYIRDSLKSIIGQSYTNLEIIVINDGSDAKTTGILEEIQKTDNRIKLFQQENHGLSYSLNKGIKEAAGEFIARMDSDDIAKKDRISRQVEFLLHNKEVVAVGSNAEVIDKDGEFVYTTQKLLDWEVIKKTLPASPFIHPSVMFRRKEAIEVGLYPIVPLSQDLFFFNKLVEKGKFRNLKEPLLQYRMHPKSLSRKSRKVRKIVFQLLEKYLLSDELDKDLLDRLKNKLDSEREKREYFYHLLLGKKYLWNNYRGRNARVHFKKAIESTMYKKLYFEPALLYTLSFFGGKFINKSYESLVKKTPSLEE